MVRLTPLIQWAGHTCTTSSPVGPVGYQEPVLPFQGVGRLTAGFGLTRFHVSRQGPQFVTRRNQDVCLLGYGKCITRSVSYLLSQVPPSTNLMGVLRARANKLSAPLRDISEVRLCLSVSGTTAPFLSGSNSCQPPHRSRPRVTLTHSFRASHQSMVWEGSACQSL